MQYLLSELSQIHDYLRMLIQVYVAWFAFFIALLVGAMGWSLKASINKTGQMARPLPFVLMYALFMSQLVLAIRATNILIHDVHCAAERVLKILLVVNTSGGVPMHVLSPVPSGIEESLKIMCITLWGNVIFWTFVAIVVFLAWWNRWNVVGNAV